MNFVRPPRPVLLPAAMVGGFGLGSLALALVPAEPASPPAPAVSQPPLALAPPAPDAPVAAWPALFGAPPPPPAPEPAPVVLPEPPPPAPPRPQARLRGLAMDEGGGWALIDLDEGITLVRPGSALGPGHTVAQITAEGVLIAAADGEWLLAFAAPEPGAAPVRQSLPRALMGGIRTFTDEGGLPMQLPPPGYVSGPGPSVGDNR